MGEMTFTKGGLVTKIHDNGDVSISVAIECDGCHKQCSPNNGLTIRDTGNEVVLWLCEVCKG